MFDSKRIISTVVRDADGQRVFWATSAREYAILSMTQGMPRTGTVVTMDRDGNVDEYTTTGFQNELNEEGITPAEDAAMLLGCEGPDNGLEPDWEQIEHNEQLLAYERQHQAAAAAADTVPW